MAVADHLAEVEVERFQEAVAGGLKSGEGAEGFLHHQKIGREVPRFQHQSNQGVQLVQVEHP